jgi:hypothetical protein
MHKKSHHLFTAAVLGCSVFSASAQEQVDDLAKKLANPIADLISFPIQANYDQNYGANDEGEVWRINVQPVIPIEINEDWKSK